METEDKKNNYTGNQPETPVIEESKPTKNKRRLLSPEEIQKRKKLLVYPMMGLAFVIVMYIILAPPKEDKERKQAGQGLNLTIPEVSGGELVEDKVAAYQQANSEQNEQERQSAMSTLSEFFPDTRQPENRDDLISEPEPPETVDQSTLAYRDIRNTLGNFYEDRSEYDALQQQIDDLQAQLDERYSEREQLDDVQQQLELMEKSYEMAARYMPQTTGTKVNPFETAAEREMDEPVNAHAKAETREAAFTVYSDAGTVVSSLHQEVSDSVFMAEQMQERNRSFLPGTETVDDIPLKNTLKVAVYETQTLKDGETVRLRLLEPARVAGMYIPKNTLLTAVARIQGNRLTLSVTSIEHRERIVHVNLSAYDLDGQPGVFIPNSLEVNAAKEIAAGMGQSAGTSFTFASSAGQQLTADAGRGLLQGASQYFGNRMREVKVTLKSGHKLFLMQNR